MDSSDDDSDGEAEPPHREGTAETEQVASSPVRHPEGAAEEGHESRSSPVDRAAAVTTKRGARAVRDSASDSDEDFGGGDSDSESDYGDKESDVDTGKGKGKKAAAPAKPKQAAAPRAKAAAKKAAAAPAAKKAPPATPARKAVAGKVSPAAARPALKKSSSSQLGSLLQSSARPTSPKAAAATRPLLSSPGSLGSLSLQMSPGSARKAGVRGGSGASSLKSLLGGSTVPRAGLSRRVQPKK
ncbi:hypothetical protein GGH95_002110 [Coemansia sp. RSA 1836]|nr:hypothetical protein GGH95_002110 [Coemansia sp. RSA 1836]